MTYSPAGLPYDPMKTDFHSWMMDQHWSARFTGEDRIRAELEKMLSKRRRRG